MGYKVRITALAPAAKQRIEHLAELLAKLPGLTQEVALHGLQKPPLDLPEVQTEADAQKLLQGLRKMGMVGDIIPHQEASSPHVAPPKLNFFDDEPKQERQRIELRETPTTVVQTKRIRGSKMLWISVTVLVALFATLLVIGNSTSPATPTLNAKEPTTAERAKQRKQKQARARFDQALKQMSTSEKFLRDAERTPDILKSAELTQKALQYNPYNMNAWTNLAAKYRRLGNEKAAVACEVKYRQSEELHRTLEGIATYFRGKPKVEISVSQVRYTVSDSGLTRLAFHQKTARLYDTVHAMHPEKEFDVETQGKQPLSVKVLPGDSFPDFDSWEDLQKKSSR
jgi:cell division protein FtsL